MQTVKEKKVPQRMCVGCRCMRPRNELLRVVKSADGEISFDPTYKAPGRGAYICRSPECWTKAVKTKALSRALKSAIPESVHEVLQDAFSMLSAADAVLGQ